jgi:hypothetical protein
VDDAELLEALRHALEREEELISEVTQRAERYANAIFALTGKSARMPGAINTGHAPGCICVVCTPPTFAEASTAPFVPRHNFQVSE